MADEKHTDRLLSPVAGMQVFNVKTAYGKFLQSYPSLRGEVKKVEFSSEAPPYHHPWLVCDEGKVYFVDNVVFVHIDPPPDDEDDPQVGPTGPPTIPPPAEALYYS